MGDSEFNPFFSDEREPETNGNPFHQNGDDDDDSFLEVNGNSNGIPPTIQVFTMSLGLFLMVGFHNIIYCSHTS